MQDEFAEPSALAFKNASARTDLAMRLLETSSACVKLIDTSGRLQAMNSPGQRLMEIDDFNVVCGAAWSELWPLNERHKIASAVEAARSGATTRLQAACPTLKGHDKWWEVTVSPVRDESGEITHIISTSYDVTPLKARELELTRALEERHRLAMSLAQQLEAETRRLTETQRRVSHSEKLRLLGQFVANVVHDMNNMLTVVQSASRAMRRTSNGASKSAVLDEVDKAVDRGVRLVRRLLDFSRAEVAAVEVFSPAQSVRRDEDLFQHLAGDRSELRLETDGEDWAILAEPSRFQSVLLNLVANARDATTEQGQIRITVASCPAVDRPPGLPMGDYVVIKVSDNGVGMTREALRRAGEPFFTTKGAGKGTGLGLASAFEFAERCSGRVSIESMREQGTTISLYLPRAAARGDAVVASPSEVDPSLHGRATLLVVEQDALVREHLSVTLRELGYVVLEASSEELALALELREMAIDLVISDLLLGSGSGVRLADRLRESRPDLPVIFLADVSGIGEPDREVVLRKPVSERGLARAILESLGRLAPKRSN